MNCDDINQLLISYHNNEVDSGHPDAVRAHLDTCQTCASKYESIVHVQSQFQQMLSDSAETASPLPNSWMAIHERIDPERGRFASLRRAMSNFLDTPVWQKRLVGSLTALTALALMVTVI